MVLQCFSQTPRQVLVSQQRVDTNLSVLCSGHWLQVVTLKLDELKVWFLRCPGHISRATHDDSYATDSAGKDRLHQCKEFCCTVRFLELLLSHTSTPSHHHLLSRGVLPAPRLQPPILHRIKDSLRAPGNRLPGFFIPFSHFKKAHS